MHGSRGDRRFTESARDFVKNDKTVFNNSVESKLIRKMVKKICANSYDVYNLNQMFGLPGEIRKDTSVEKTVFLDKPMTKWTQFKPLIP